MSTKPRSYNSEARFSHQELYLLGDFQESGRNIIHCQVLAIEVNFIKKERQLDEKGIILFLYFITLEYIFDNI